MKQRPRIYYSDSQKALMWERWKQGWTLHEIGKLFDRAHSSIHRILGETGGIRPAQRARAATALTLAQRENISRAIVGASIRAIAARLGRAPSTICREMKRNGGHHSYRANQADAAAWDRARRPKCCKLVANRALAQTALPGHWEGDLVFGSGNSQIATLVARQTRYVMLIKLDGKDTQTVVNALIKHARKLPQELYKSLTWDRGAEMDAHKQFTLATDIQVYFCDPQSPWQRGSNMSRFSGEWPHICREKINKGGLKPALVR